MRILVCPDTFTGTIDAADAARAIADGWTGAAPDDEITIRAVVDGGPGFLACLSAARPDSRLLPVATTDPLGRPVSASVLMDGSTGYVESAAACGLHLLGPDERDPATTTSAGVGRLIAAAVTAGAREVVVGLGGSGTNDAGAGLLGALGAEPWDDAGQPVPPGGLALAGCARLSGPARLAEGVRLVAATDVDNPLTGPDGATMVFGPQKGLRPEQAGALDAALGHYAAVLERDLPGCPPGLAGLPGAGAAGGLGAALLACGGRRVSGLALVRQLTGLDEAVAGSDLVITGEGSFDEQSLHGKLVAGVAEVAREHGVRCVVIAGRITVAEDVYRAAGVSAAYALVDELGSVEAARSRPADGLSAVAARLAAQAHP